MGIPLALAAGGSMQGWSRVRIRWALLLVLAFIVELVVYNPPVDRQPWALTWGPLLWLMTKVVMLSVFLRNARDRRGLISPWLLAAVGITLNTVAIALNDGHMPQSLAAREAVWGAAPVKFDQPGRLYNVAPMTETARLPWLGDTIPEPRWFPRPNVVSVGDLLLALGICWWTWETTSAVRRQRPARVATA